MRDLRGRVLLALFAASLSPSSATALCEPERWNLPTQFRLDTYVLSLVVEEPARDTGAGWALHAKLLRPVHVPEVEDTFDLFVRESTTDGCPGAPLAEAELRDRYARGDELLLVGYRSARGGLETFTDWLSYGSEVRVQQVQSAFDYVSALFRLETYELDTERIGPLRSIAVFVEDASVYRRILQSQLRSKRLRRRMMTVHASLHESD